MLIDSPTFRLGNMLYIKSGSQFDVVINMFFSFGFFETDEENRRVAKNFFNLLKPGGKFLMHTDVNMARVRNGTYKFTEVRPLQNGETLAIMERFNPRTKRIEGIWEISDGLHRCEAKDYSVRVYENEEFVELCRNVGFRKVKIYSDWSGSPYNEESEMVIFVAEK
jgi:SAM-dependent methyltransferase